MTTLLLLNAAATWYMVGVIWFVQLVHYPMLARLDRASYREAQRFHQRWTGWVVGPPMLVELTTSLVLLWLTPGWLTGIGVGLVGVWAVSTALAQVPLHERLAAGGFDEECHRRLVRSNWLRTVAWTAHGIVCGLLLGGSVL